ncbi:hypothetical protein HPB47_007886, partial [Ixodes persulcatus]
MADSFLPDARSTVLTGAAGECVLASTGHPDVQLAKGHLDFGVRLLTQIRFSSKNTGNILFSLTSVATALATFSLGTKGKSRDELLATLKNYQEAPAEQDILLAAYNSYLGNMLSPKVTLETAIVIIVEKTIPLLGRNKEDISEAFGAKIHSVDILENPSEATSDINDW